MSLSVITPDWPAPAAVKAFTTTRCGGKSEGIYTGLNLGDHVGDAPAIVDVNRALLQGSLPVDVNIQWLSQVHGTAVLQAPCATDAPQGDALWTEQQGLALSIMTADCLPVLMCNQAGTVVAAAHAGWRGLVAGVIEETVAALPVAAEELLVWLGPAIGPAVFEVGEEVRAAFLSDENNKERAVLAQYFQINRHRPDHYLCDLYGLARYRLTRMGVRYIYGGTFCTYSDDAQFYSYRRDGQTGRMATLIYLNSTNLPS